MPQEPILYSKTEKTIDSKDHALTAGDEATDDDAKGKSLQHGVRRAQAVKQVWTRNHLILAYALYVLSFRQRLQYLPDLHYQRSCSIWLANFMMAYSSGITGTLTPYVTSSFEAHSLTALTSVISGLIAGLVKLPYAKLINIWGRPQGFAVMVCSMTLGLIMMAGCNNVRTYCAAQVFYNVGYNGIDFTNTIFIADTSSLKSRALVIAFTSSPWIATVWAYGPTAQYILEKIGFRWGFGIWAIFIPLVCSPLFGLFYYNQLKAKKQGLLDATPSNRTFSENIIYYCREFRCYWSVAYCYGPRAISAIIQHLRLPAG